MKRRNYASAKHVNIKYVEHGAKSLPQAKKKTATPQPTPKPASPACKTAIRHPRRRVPERKTKNRRQSGCRSISKEALPASILGWVWCYVSSGTSLAGLGSLRHEHSEIARGPHSRTEGRAPVWGFAFSIKGAIKQGSSAEFVPSPCMAFIQGGF
jgi:hypothetical protein